MKSRKKRKIEMDELLILFHSLDIERKELQNIQEKLTMVTYVKRQLTNTGLDTDNVDVLLKQLERQQDYSKQMIRMLSEMIPEKADTKKLQTTVNQYLSYENMDYQQLAKEVKVSVQDFEMFMKTGNADNYVILKLFEYFQSHKSL